MPCNLRMIHKDDAGIPTAAPSMIRVATTCMSEDSMETEDGRLTEIAPHRSSIQRVVGPHHRVDELVKTRQGGPKHVETGSGIPSLKMPWERDQHKDET